MYNYICRLINQIPILSVIPLVFILIMIIMWGTFEDNNADDVSLDAKQQEQAAAPDVVAFARGILSFDPDTRQAEILRSNAKRGILNCSRQWGKTTLAAIKAIHRAQTVPGSLIIIATPTERQSGEFLEKIRVLLTTVGITPRGDGHNRLSIRFPNASRIVGLPGKHGNVRGFSRVSLMIIDEAVWVPDALYKSLRPMLAVGNGDLWIMSTPQGKTGFFYEAWEYGGERWTRFKVPVTDCGRISEDFLKDELQSLGTQCFRREYLCEFIDDAGGIFDRILIEQALDSTVEWLRLS